MKNLEHLIIKYFEDNLSDEETNHLKNLLENEENRLYFKEFVHLNHLINSKTEFKYKNGLVHFEEKIHKSFRFRSVLKYAATILIFLSAGYFFLTKEDASINDAPIIVNNNIKVGTDKATLTLENGEQVILAKGASFQTQNATSNGEEIVYNKAASKDITYNTLTVPRGAEFQITLADGTQVWLNSESQFKYPIAFTKGQTRQVELVYGEAYFDVSPSTAHQGSNFKVLHDAQEVQVLGTEFNIKAYKDEANVYTTLVEGEVAVNVNNRSTVLIPNEQANLDKDTKNISITVVDVFNEISWKNGVFSFENKSLNDLMQVLSRWYDVEVVFENNALKNVEFFGKLKKSQGVEDILTAIKNSSVINNYEINNKTIILK